MIKVFQRPTITMKEIVISYDKNTPDGVISDSADYIGKYPYIQIGNTPIKSNDIINITLYNSQFLPKMELQFRDPTNRIIDPLFPIDDTIISLFIKSSSEILMPVRMDFKITNIVADKANAGENNEIIFTLTCLLDINYLYFTPFSAFKGSSFDNLKQISTEAKLGFSSNIDSTDDSMTWINAGDTNINYIKDIVSYSYKSDSSFLFAYIDFYYNLNYVDIETALSEDISNQQAIFSPIFSDKDDNVAELVLSNHSDKANTNMYINKYKLINSSTAVNLNIGYQSMVYYYDKDGNTYYKTVMDTITTQGNNGENLIMKGRVGEISELVGNNTNNVITGKVDIDNVHAHFLYASEQNAKNLEYLQKVKMLITLPLMNFNIFRFQKINIKFYKMDEIVSGNDLAADNISKQDVDKINKRLSGEWLITGINYTFNTISGFNQEVTVVKRELGFNDEDFKK